MTKFIIISLRCVLMGFDKASVCKLFWLNSLAAGWLLRFAISWMHTITILTSTYIHLWALHIKRTRKVSWSLNLFIITNWLLSFCVQCNQERRIDCSSTTASDDASGNCAEYVYALSCAQNSKKSSGVCAPLCLSLSSLLWLEGPVHCKQIDEWSIITAAATSHRHRVMLLPWSIEAASEVNVMYPWPICVQNSKSRPTYPRSNNVCSIRRCSYIVFNTCTTE